MRRLIWVVLGTAGVAWAMLIASGYNALFQDKSLGLNLGPNGPMEIQFHGDLYPAVGWFVIVAVALVIVIAAYNRYYDILATVAGGVFIIGALYQSILPYPQAQLWPWGAGLALIGLVFGWMFTQLGFYKKPTAAPTSTTHERTRTSDSLE